MGPQDESGEDTRFVMSVITYTREDGQVGGVGHTIHDVPAVEYWHRLQLLTPPYEDRQQLLTHIEGWLDEEDVDVEEVEQLVDLLSSDERLAIRMLVNGVNYPEVVI